MFEIDENPGDTFTAFYMNASYLNEDFDTSEQLALRIISENKSREKDECFKPYCGNAGYDYIFAIYAAKARSDDQKLPNICPSSGLYEISIHEKCGYQGIIPFTLYGTKKH